MWIDLGDGSKLATVNLALKTVERKSAGSGTDEETLGGVRW